MALKDWRKESMPKMGWWVERYWNGKITKTLQMGEYRKADDIDKKLGIKYKWHGKFYVNMWEPETEKLFDTKAQAIAYAKAYMRSH